MLQIADGAESAVHGTCAAGTRGEPSNGVHRTRYRRGERSLRRHAEPRASLHSTRTGHRRIARCCKRLPFGTYGVHVHVLYTIAIFLQY